MEIKKIVLITVIVSLLIISLAGLLTIFNDLSSFFIFPEETGVNGQNDTNGQGTGLPSDDQNEGSSDSSSTIDVSSTISPECKQSSKVAVFEIKNNDDTSYIRTSSAEYYDGKVWKITDNPSKVPYSSNSLFSASEYKSKVTDSVTITPRVTFPAGFIPTSLYPTSITSVQNVYYYPNQQTFYTTNDINNQYQFTTTHYTFNTNLIWESSASDSVYVQLPDDITKRTKQLAVDVTESAQTNFEKVTLIQTYLKNNYEYNLSYERSPTDWESTDWFLFEEKKGVCSNFNSAFVVLLRSINIHCRLAKGYLVTPQNEPQTVYSTQAHAWTEVSFGNHRWMIFDATPSSNNGNEDTGEDKEDSESNNQSDPEVTLIPTKTRITDYPTVINKDEKNVIITGDVKTQDGTGVSDIPINLFVNETKDSAGRKIAEGNTNNQGVFRITCSIPSSVLVGNYQLVAQSTGKSIQSDEKILMYQSSWSDPEIKIIASTRISLQLPSSATIGETVSLQGFLEEKNNQPVSDQTVSWYIDNQFIGDQITDADGFFSIDHSFNTIGKYTINTLFPGTDYYEESEQVQTINVTNLGIDILTPTIWIRNESVEISGTVLSNGNPSKDITVSIYLNETNIFTGETDNTGFFTTTHTISQNKALHQYTLNYTLPSKSTFETQKIFIKAKTHLLLNNKPTVQPNTNHSLCVTLFDDTDQVLNNKNIVFTNNNSMNSTNKQGQCCFPFSINKTYTSSTVTVQFHFDETTKYINCHLAKTLPLKTPEESAENRLMNILVITAILSGILITIIVIIWLLKKRKQQFFGKSKNGKENKSGHQPISSTTITNGITIYFPDIKHNFPNVWGVNEKIRIIGQLKNNQNENTVNIKIPEEIETTKQMSNGKTLFTHTFSNKGVYTITIKNNNGSHPSLIGEESIKIVDYREEIITLFNSVLKQYNDANSSNPLPVNATPRDLEQRLINFLNIEKRYITLLRKIFEEAEYSIHKIDRQKYESMYVAFAHIQQNWREL